MKSFQSFYGQKQFEKSINDVERQKIERTLKRTLEDKMKEVRNNLMETTTFKGSPQLSEKLNEYLNHIEDCESGRLTEGEKGTK